MEDPADLLRRVLAFADAHPQIQAVIQTGSRARGDRVDALSDLDIELIGPGAADLVGNDEWLSTIGEVLVSVHLANEEPDEPDWPTCLAVFAGGRKVDFTLAGVDRVERLKDGGLDDLYQRGYIVHRDKTGITGGLPAAMMAPPVQSPPAVAELEANQREFWFEATQVPVYLARGDLWPAALRQAEMRDLLLTMLEWNAAARSGGAVDTWHNGHHLQEWIPDSYHARIAPVFAQYDAVDCARALRALIDLYSDVARETARLTALPLLDLKAKVVAHIDSVLSIAS